MERQDRHRGRLPSSIGTTMVLVRVRLIGCLNIVVFLGCMYVCRMEVTSSQLRAAVESS